MGVSTTDSRESLDDLPTANELAADFDAHADAVTDSVIEPQRTASLDQLLRTCKRRVEEYGFVQPTRLMELVCVTAEAIGDVEASETLTETERDDTLETLSLLLFTVSETPAAPPVKQTGPHTGYSQFRLQEINAELGEAVDETSPELLCGVRAAFDRLCDSLRGPEPATTQEVEDVYCKTAWALKRLPDRAYDCTELLARILIVVRPLRSPHVRRT